MNSKTIYIGDLTSITNSSLLIASIFLCSSLDNLVNNFTICYIYRRYNKANNKYLRSFDSKQISQEIIYLDRKKIYFLCVHLYGYTMYELQHSM